MALHDLLNSLDKVRKTGPNRYMACCPAHQDKRPSLTIAETDAGVVLIKCWSGCGAAEILAAVRLEFSDLYPPRTDSHGKKPVKRPWNPYDVLKIMAFEASICRIAASDMANNKPLSDIDQERLCAASANLQRAVEQIRG